MRRTVQLLLLGLLALASLSALAAGPKITKKQRKELEDQFKLFTLTMRYPADGPDAVEGANRIIDELIRRIEPPVFRSRKDVRKRNKKRL